MRTSSCHWTLTPSPKEFWIQNVWTKHNAISNKPDYEKQVSIQFNQTGSPCHRNHRKSVSKQEVFRGAHTYRLSDSVSLSQTSNHWQCFCSLQIGKNMKHHGQMYTSESKQQKSSLCKIKRLYILEKKMSKNVYMCVVSCNYSEL